MNYVDPFGFNADPSDPSGGPNSNPSTLPQRYRRHSPQPCLVLISQSRNLISTTRTTPSSLQTVRSDRNEQFRSKAELHRNLLSAETDGCDRRG